MATFWCPDCDRLIDNDETPGEELEGDFICPDCYEKWLDENEPDIIIEIN